MAWTSGFFNSIDKDRLYTADQISGMFEGLITNGVFASLGNKMVVQPNSGMTIQINTGRGFFNGRWVKNDAPHLLILDAADVTLNRYCAVCVRVDTNMNARTAAPYLKYSEFATTPVKPEMERSELVQEYCLAYVYIKANATTITAADIEDTRANTNLCGWVTGLIEQLDSDTLWEQWDAEFYTWFERMKDQLTEDAAGNLQEQVDDINTVIGNLQTQIKSDFMPKAGGKFTGDVSHKASLNEYFETINGYKFRIGTGTTEDIVYLQAVDSTNKWIADIIKFNASTGEITGGNLMPKADLLWDNASPTSSMAAQSITIPDTTKYKFMILQYKEYAGGNSTRTTIIFNSGEAVSLDSASTKGRRYRGVSIAGTTFKVNAGNEFEKYGESSTQDNESCIPLKLYGVH